MVRLEEIVGHLDAELRLSEIPDYPGALNGLQMEGGGEVRAGSTDPVPEPTPCLHTGQSTARARGRPAARRSVPRLDRLAALLTVPLDEGIAVVIGDAAVSAEPALLEELFAGNGIASFSLQERLL